MSENMKDKETNSQNINIQELLDKYKTGIRDSRRDFISF